MAITLVSPTAVHTHPLTKAERRALNKQTYKNLSPTQAPVVKDLSTAFQDTPLSIALIALIASYINNAPTYLIPERFDLLDITALKPLFGARFQTDAHQNSAKQYIEQMIQTGVAETVDDRATYLLHPVCAEIYIYALRLFDKQHPVVLELAAARGPYSVLLGFSDARTIYVNDTNLQELSIFQECQKKLPKNVREKYTLLPGNCLVTETYKHIKEKVDFVAACNLLHFFSPTQTDAFFKRLHEVMKPGSQALFTTNSGKKPWMNVWTCAMVDSRKIHQREIFIYEESLPNTTYPRNTKTRTLFVRTNRGWGKRDHAFENLPTDVVEAIDTIFINHGKPLNAAPLGTTITLRVASACFFTKRSLAHLVTQHGFEPNYLFYTDPAGHIITKKSVDETAHRVGVLCTKALDPCSLKQFIPTPDRLDQKDRKISPKQIDEGIITAKTVVKEENSGSFAVIPKSPEPVRVLPVAPKTAEESVRIIPIVSETVAPKIPVNERDAPEDSPTIGDYCIALISWLFGRCG
jgi:hypothetical protein